jgi:glycosyltransferase involved in cell wall biosynthesis
MPLVTILTPCRDGAAYIHKMIESVQAQNISDFELLVVDDGSKDSSREIVLEYAENDHRIRLLCSPGQGIVSAMNYGIALSDSKFLARIDADDEMSPDRLQEQLKEFRRHKELTVCGSSLQVVDAIGHEVGIVNFPVNGHVIVKSLREGRWVLAHPSVMYIRTAIEGLGSYSEQSRHAEDLDLWLRLAAVGYKFRNIPRPLTKFRVHGKNDTILNSELQKERRIYAISRDYFSRKNVGKVDEQRFASIFAMVLAPTSKIKSSQLDVLYVALGSKTLREILKGGFLFNKFIFSLIVYALKNRKIKFLFKILKIIIRSRVNLPEYLLFYIIYIFPINISNRKAVKAFKTRNW